MNDLRHLKKIIIISSKKWNFNIGKILGSCKKQSIGTSQKHFNIFLLFITKFQKIWKILFERYITENLLDDYRKIINFKK